MKKKIFIFVLFASLIFAKEDFNIRLLATRNLAPSWGGDFEYDLLRFCSKQGFEVLEINRQIIYFNKNYYLFNYPSDLDIKQSPGISQLMNLKPYETINGLDSNSSYLFTDPQLNYPLIDNFKKEFEDSFSETGRYLNKIDIDLLKSKSPSGEDILIAHFNDEKNYPNNFWLYSYLEKYKIKIKDRIVNVYQLGKIRNGIDAMAVKLKEIKKEIKLNPILLSPGNIIESGVFQAADNYSKLYLDILKEINFEALNVDYYEIELFIKLLSRSEQGFFDFKKLDLPFISSNFFYNEDFEKQLIENGYLEDISQKTQENESGELKSAKKNENDDPVVKTRRHVFKPYIIKEINGLKIGFIGITDTDAVKDIPGLRKYFHVSSNIRRQEEAIKELREKVDLLVLLAQFDSHGTADLEDFFTEIDIYIGKAYVGTNIDEESINLTDLKNRSIFKNSVISKVINRRITQIDLSVKHDKNEKPYLNGLHSEYIKLYENLAKRDINISQELWKYVVNQAFSQESQKLLPDPRKVWRDYKFQCGNDECEKIYLKTNEFSRLVASLMRQGSDSEIAFVPYFSTKGNSTGEISQAQIENWLRGSGDIVTCELSGSQILSFIDKIKAMTFSNDYRYTIVGLDTAVESNVASLYRKNPYVKDSITLHWKQIDPTEYYKVVTTDKMFMNTEMLPEFKTAKNVKKNFIYKNKKIKSTFSSEAKLSIKNFAILNLRDINKEIENDINNKLLKSLPSNIVNLMNTENKIIKAKLDKLVENSKNEIKEKEYNLYYEKLKEIYWGLERKKGPFYLINLKKISFDFAKSDLMNNEDFGEVQNSRITSYDTFFLGGTSDLYFEMYDKKYSLTIGNELAFSKSTFYTPEETLVNITNNEIYTYAEIFYKLFEAENSKLLSSAGPFFELAWDTQFVAPVNTTKRNSAIVIGGAKIYEGSEISECKIGGIADLDYSSGNGNEEFGLYGAIDIQKYLFSNSIIWETQSDLVYFFDSVNDDATDLGLEWTTRSELMVPFLGQLYLSPFVDFILFTGKTNHELGYGLDFGVSLEYTKFWKPQFQSLF
ncbi:MAG: 5'-nucleotidase C-terminal domain-containing protein [Pseudomonadota bacterium]